MAYDRYDPEQRWRDRDQRDPRGWGRGRDVDRYRDDAGYGGEGGDRGFFERMGEEVRSWFGDEDRSGDYRRDDQERGRPTYSERDYNPRYENERERSAPRARSGDRDRDRGDVRDRDPYRRTSFAGPRGRSSHEDVHYDEWRRRQLEDLDRDYGEYRRERQAKFEEDFGGWRERRQTKRQILGEIREHMEVVGSDGEHVGTVDRTSGDRLILTRSDPQSGGVHHSLSCTEIDRIDGDRVVLDVSAEKARERWRDEDRERALFEREDQGRAGPHVLDRSFSGTYR